MNNYDDLFTSSEDFRETPFDKDEWAQAKQAERQEVYEMADNTAIAVSKDGPYFQQYLDTQARFPRYSVTNVLLIMAQNPDATQLKDFDGWKEAGASIQKGRKGLSIVEPGKEYERDDGTIGTSFNVKKVFDVVQTTIWNRSRQPQPSVDDRTLLTALIHKSPVPMKMVDELPSNTVALYDNEQQVIFVRRGMDAQDLFRGVSKELAHAEIALSRDSYSRSEASFAAYSASYILCKQYNVPTEGHYNFSALPEGLSTKTPQELRGVLNEIRDTANSISNRMYRVLEQAKAPRAQEQER